MFYFTSTNTDLLILLHLLANSLTMEALLQGMLYERLRYFNRASFKYKNNLHCISGQKFQLCLNTAQTHIERYSLPGNLISQRLVIP